MASNAVKEAPLSFMTPLNEALAYLDAESQPRRSDPALILVLAWMNARDVHVAKYIQQHRILFPSSRILLARCTLAQYSRTAYRRRLLEPAMPLLREHAQSRDESAQLLVHVFSNGGVSSAVTLWDLWAEALGDGAQVPRHVVLMDSCPGYYTWQGSHFAIAGSLPLWMSPLVHLLLLGFWLAYTPWGRAPPPDANADAMNHGARLQREVSRTYLYGTGDEAVAWADVEKHAAQAAERGAKVLLEKFEGGRHVAHVRVDGERYWRIVEETWAARLSTKGEETWLRHP